MLETPGHTLDHISYVFDSEKALFAADTLFSIGCGRVFEGTYPMMWDSLLKLRALPDDFRLYCGHEYTASNVKFALSVESDNPALQARAAEEQRKSDETEVIPSGVDIRREPAETGFDCPHLASPLFGRRPCNLVMVLGADDDRDSFERVASFVGEFDPAIRTLVVDDRAGWEAGLPPRPTLVFSPGASVTPTALK